MKYRFSKEFVPRKFIEGQGWLTNFRIYKLMDEQRLIGTLDYHDTLHTITFGDRQFVIEVREPFFKKSSYKLFDTLTDELVGEFKISSWRINTFRFDKLQLGQNEYFTFEETRPAIPFSIFKKDSWGNHRFQLTNGAEAAVYDLKMKRKLIESYREHLPFTGFVEHWGNDLLLIFAGFFLIERYFKNEESG